MHKKRLFLSFIAFCSTLTALLAGFVLATPVAAQGDYKLVVQRNFGYGGFNNDIRGNFTISISGDETAVASVKFTIDGQEMSTVSQAPFKFNFVTGDYADGVHQLGALVTLKAGTSLELPAKTYTFLSASAEKNNMSRIFIPILGIIGGVIVIVVALQILMSRRRPASVTPGTQRQYGLSGGSICPKCGRPTPLHVMGINMLTGKYDRCENCGKWSIMRRAPIDILRKAEAAEIVQDQPSIAPEKSEEEKLREMLDKSKYMD